MKIKNNHVCKMLRTVSYQSSLQRSHLHECLKLMGCESCILVVSLPGTVAGPQQGVVDGPQQGVVDE